MQQQLRLNLAAGLNQLAVRIYVLVVSMVVGAFVGLIAVAFFKVVALSAAWWSVPLPTSFAEIEWHYSPFVGFALLASALIAGQVLKLLKQGRPHGPSDLIASAQIGEPLDLKSGFVSSFLALNNLCGAASVGIFGPLVHLGGCLSRWLQKSSTKISHDVVLGAGAGAAIAAVFSAPIGAAIYAHEAIIRRFGTFGAGPVLACTFGAYWVANALLGKHRFFSVGDAPILDSRSLLIALALGVAAGLISSIYIYSVTESPKLSKASHIPLQWQPLLPALLIFLISPLLPHLLGTGMGSVTLAMQENLALTLVITLLFSKIVITTLCLGFRYYGGVFAPALFFGAMLGSLFDLALADLGWVQSSSYVALGAASCIATVIGAPMASIVIVFEMTGSYEWAVLSMVSVVVSAQISRSFVGRSLFDRQLAARGVVMKDDYEAKVN
ncbi:MAG: chloride channel protein [Gammaproteobacteria bacterium]|nr:chloride channel protein [Gammaproteobacteria bacterium]